MQVNEAVDYLHSECRDSLQEYHISYLVHTHSRGRVRGRG